MRVALDIDGTLDEHPGFFAFLSQSLRGAGHEVFILTYRDPDSVARVAEQLLGWGIVFDELVFATSLEDKGKQCRDLAIDVFIDDMDECIVPVARGTLVLKVRNEGNFDFDEQRWVSTARLTRLL